MAITTPVLEITTVYHVGTLDRTLRAPAGSSHEGSALSVSTCPAAWESIARLGGRSLIRMYRPSALFIDALALTPKQIDEIRHWSVSAGLAEMRTSWLAWRYDDEIEEWSAMQCRSRREALLEMTQDLENDLESLADDELPQTKMGGTGDGDSPPGGAFLQEKTAPVLTGLGRRRGGGFGQDTDASDLILLMWAEDVARRAVSDVVGVWWNEALEPDRLSAPRGAVFETSIPEFKAAIMPWSSVPNDEVLSRRMKTRQTYLTPRRQHAVGCHEG